MSLLKKFIREEEGLELVEYAVMAALLVAGVVLAVTTLGGTVKTKFENVNTGISGTGNPN